MSCMLLLLPTSAIEGLEQPARKSNLHTATCNTSHVTMHSGHFAGCTPGVTFGCVTSASQRLVWVDHQCSGWFVLDGTERHVCGRKHCWSSGLPSADGGSLLIPNSSLATKMARLEAQLIMDPELLSLIEAEPEFARIPLVHVDAITHSPTLLHAHDYSATPSNSSRLRSYRRFVYNPSLIGDNDLFVKVSPFAHCALGNPGFTLTNRNIKGSHSIVWMQRRTIRGVVSDAEDPFAIRLRGRAHILFARKRGHSSAMVLAALEPTYRETALNYSRMSIWEKNWAPFEHDGALHVVYRLCPLRVLRCDPDSGSCEEVPTSRQQPSRCDKALSGSGPVVAYNRSHFLGVAHRKRTLSSSHRWAWRVGIDRIYEHSIYLLAHASPSFELAFISESFHFPRFFGTEVDLVQFAGGLAIDAEDAASPGVARNATIAYGVADCVAMRVRLPVDELLVHDDDRSTVPLRALPPPETAGSDSSGSEELIAASASVVERLLRLPSNLSLGRERPRLLLQTWSNRSCVPFMVYDQARRFAAGYQHAIFDDGDAARFIHERLPSAVAARYNTLKLGAHRADMLRYGLMYHFGGVYLDIETVLVRPLDESLPNVAVSYTARSAFSGIMQGILASPPAQPIYLALLEDMVATPQREVSLVVAVLAFLPPTSYFLLPTPCVLRPASRTRRHSFLRSVPTPPDATPRSLLKGGSKVHDLHRPLRGYPSQSARAAGTGHGHACRQRGAVGAPA